MNALESYLKSKQAFLNWHERTYSEVVKKSANELIEEAIISQPQSLNLQRQNLHTFPEDICQIKSLRVLDLSNNNLSSLPDSISELDQLERIKLGQNRLRDFPSSILSISSLTHLDLGRNSIRIIPNEIEKLQNLEVLQLYNNKIENLTTGLNSLKSLRSLGLNRNRVKDISKLTRLFNLQVLQLYGNQIEVIPESIARLRNLKVLGLVNNKIRHIPGSIKDLVNLQELALGKNRIEVIPPEIGENKSLRKLFLSENKIKELPKEIGNLKRLSKLKIYNNECRSLPLSMEEMIDLRFLDLENNKIESISIDLGLLKNLKTANFQGNQINALPKSLVSIEAIEVLVNRNPIQIIPEELIYQDNIKLVNKQRHVALSRIHKAHLKESQYLNLSDLGLKTIPVEIQKLKKLQTLILEGNLIEDISPLQELKKLKKIDLRNNFIRELPDWIVQYDLEINRKKKANNNALLIYDNPIKSPPPEILKQGLFATQTWFERKRSEGVIALNEAKMILIGDGLVGKTSIITKLKDEKAPLPKPKDRTHGLEIRTWYPFSDDDDEKHQSFKLNVWDFGGQGKYRDIQQFFCSRNTLYIYVTAPQDVNLEKYTVKNDPYSGFDYWVQFVQKFGFDEEKDHKSPIIYVVNKIDLDEGLIDQKKERAKYPKLTFNKISCKHIKERRHEFNSFREAIKRTIPEISHDIFEQSYPPSWIEVKSDIEELRKNGVNTITIDEYEAICKKHGLTTRKSLDSNKALSDSTIWKSVLSDIGTVIHFGRITPLQGLMVINPEWLKKAAQNVLDYSKAVDNKGLFNREDFEYIWKEYELKDYNSLIELMKAFELCYQQGETYFVPALFSYRSKRVESLPLFKRIRVTYLDYMPAGVIWKLIVKNHEYIHNGKVWRSGLLMIKNDSVIQVIENWKQKKIDIYYLGENGEKVANSIISQIKNINDDLYEAKFTDEITIEILRVCSCSICATSKRPEAHSLSVESVKCIKSGEEIIFNESKGLFQRLEEQEDELLYWGEKMKGNMIREEIRNEILDLNISFADMRPLYGKFYTSKKRFGRELSKLNIPEELFESINSKSRYSVKKLYEEDLYKIQNLLVRLLNKIELIDFVDFYFSSFFKDNKPPGFYRRNSINLLCNHFLDWANIKGYAVDFLYRIYFHIDENTELNDFIRNVSGKQKSVVRELVKPQDNMTVKTFTIFLASSKELAEERKEFEIYINRENKRWIGEKGIFLRLENWEDSFDAMSNTRKQDDYNELVKNCDLFVILVATKVGKYTKEEFEVAYNHFKASGKPLILTYFKTGIAVSTDNVIANPEIIENLQGLRDFKEKINSLNHFETPFANTDGLLKHFGEQLRNYKIPEKNGLKG